MSTVPVTTIQERTRSAYVVEAVTTEDALRLLEADWNRLSESTDPKNAFATFGWYAAWARHFSELEGRARFQPEVLVFKRDGDVAGIAPLARRVTKVPGLSVRRLGFVTAHADYNQLLVGADHGGLTAAFAEHLARTAAEWDMLDLRDLPEDAVAATQLKEALLRAGLTVRESAEAHRCPCLSIAEGGAELQMTRLSGHVRRVLKKRCREAEDEGARVRVIEHPEAEPGLLQTMLALERDKHERSEYLPLLAPLERVFQDLFDKLGPRGWLYVALLERCGEPVAYQLGFRCGDKLWDYNKAYKRAYSKLAPGTLLSLALFDYGFAHGFREYDFLRGEEEYKLVWSTEFRSRSRIVAWNRRPGSRFRQFLYSDVKPVVYRMLGRQQ